MVSSLSALVNTCFLNLDVCDFVQRCFDRFGRFGTGINWLGRYLSLQVLMSRFLWTGIWQIL